MNKNCKRGNPAFVLYKIHMESMTKREILAQYSWKHDGDWAKIAQALQTHEPLSRRYQCGNYITIYDELYPPQLRSLRHPPWVLFYRGNPELLKRPSAAVVGSRKLTEYGEWATERCTELLADQFVIVSGLAKGADGAAHRTAIAMRGSTIGVIGCGMNVRYPRENEYLYRRMEKEQLILSEYPDTTGVKKYHFPWRNRILAALGDCVIVTQAALKSGTMGTVSAALELGKEVWCVPYPYNMEAGKGCNLLIAQGANILYDEAVLKNLRPLRSI